MNVEVAVVAELLRVADLGAEHVELGVGPLLGLLAHPVEPGDGLAVGPQQVADQVLHHRLRGGREVAGDVLTPDRLTDRALDQGHATLPALPQLGRAAEGAAVEVEVRLHERRREVRRAGAHDAGGQPGAPVVDRDLLERRGQVLQVGRLPDAGLGDGDLGPPEVADERLPVEGRAQAVELLDRGQVVGLLHVAGLGALPVALGQPGLDRHHRRRGGGGVGMLDHGEDAGQERDVLLAGLGELLVAVVGLVGQPQPALHQVDQAAVGVLAVDVDVEAEGSATAEQLELAEERREVTEVAQGVDGVEQGLDRLVAGRLDPRLVHEGGIEGGDPGGVVVEVGVAAEHPLGELLDDRVDLVLGDVGQLDERPPPALVGRDLGRLEPPAVDMTEQVVLRTDGQVHALAGGVERAHPQEPTQGL